jgi:hypothetical protein
MRPEKTSFSSMFTSFYLRSKDYNILFKHPVAPKYLSYTIYFRQTMQLFPWQLNSFGIIETPDDGRLRPKHVVKGRRDGDSSIVDEIIL